MRTMLLIFHLTRLRANMYLSPVYISKIFKEETGRVADSVFDKNPAGKGKGNIRKRKLRKCAQCHSLAVGYEDVYYFSKLFKKYYGIAPVYYKRQAQKENGKELK